MKQSKTKTFHYKVAKFNNDPEGFSLQELVEEAYDNTSAAFDCAYSFQQDGENTHLINYFSGNHRKDGVDDVMLGAEFLSFVKGNDPTFIDTAQSSRELPLTSLNLSAEGKEAIEGAIYLGVVDNDVVITQSMALRSAALEKYLNWFIRTKGTLWTKENYVGLCDPEFPLSSKGKNPRNNDPREISISTPVHFLPIEEASHQKEFNVKASGAGIEMVKAFLGSFSNEEKFIEEFKMEDLTNSRSLEIELKLRWTGGRNEPKPFNLMEQVTRQLRHVTDEIDYEIKNEDGTTITKDMIKKSMPHSVKWDGARPVFDDLFPKMLKWIASNRK